MISLIGNIVDKVLSIFVSKVDPDKVEKTLTLKQKIAIDKVRKQIQEVKDELKICTSAKKKLVLDNKLNTLLIRLCDLRDKAN